jgi:hypothetical protein
MHKTIFLELHSDPPRYKLLSVSDVWVSEELVRELCADGDWTVYARQPGQPRRRISQDDATNTLDGRPAVEDAFGHDRLLEALLKSGNMKEGSP